MPAFKRLLATTLLLMSCGLAAAQQAPILIKFSHVNATNSPKNQAAEYFRKLPRTAPRGG